MKKNILGLFAVALAIGFSSFSVRAVNTWFAFDASQTSNANVFDPAMYTATATPANPANLLDVVAFIKVDGATSGASAEVYPSTYSIVAHRGKPRVDVSGSLLQNDITTAITTPMDIADRVYLK